jgi:hypothetical protein
MPRIFSGVSSLVFAVSTQLLSPSLNSKNRPCVRSTYSRIFSQLAASATRWSGDMSVGGFDGVDAGCVGGGDANAGVAGGSEASAQY